MRSFALAALLPIVMSGCAGNIQGKLSTIQGGIEELSVAPLMTCAVVVQQSQMVLNKLATGTVIAPAIAPAPTKTTPPPINMPTIVPSPGIPSMFPTGPMVTPQ